MKHATIHGTTVGLASCILAGIMMLIGSVVWFIAPQFYGTLGIRGLFKFFGNFPPPDSLLAGFMLLFAVLFFVGTYYVYMADGYEMVGGIFVIVISLVSLIAGGGIIVGTIFGVVGGLLGIASTRESAEEAIVKPKDKEEHERF